MKQLIVFIIFITTFSALANPKENDLIRLDKYWTYYDNSNQLPYKNAILQKIIYITKSYKDPISERIFFIHRLGAFQELIYLELTVGDYEKAKLNIDIGFRLSDEIKSQKTRVLFLQLLAQYYFSTRKYILAEQTIGKAINDALIFNKTINPNSNFTPIDNNDLSIYYDLQGQILTQLAKSKGDNHFINAINSFQKAISLTNIPNQKATYYANLAWNYTIHLDFILGKRYFQLSENYTDKNYPLYQHFRRINNEGYLFFLEKNYKKALEKYAIALSIAKKIKIGNNEYLTTLYNDIATCYLESYSESKNKELLKTALDFYINLDFLIDRMKKSQIRESKLFWRGEAHDIYENALETCFLLSDSLNAYRFMEKSRAAILYEDLTNKSLTLSKTTFLPLDSLVNYTQNHNQYFLEYFLGKKAIYVLVFTPNRGGVIEKLKISPNEFKRNYIDYLIYCTTYKNWFRKLLDLLLFWREDENNSANQLYNALLKPLNIPLNRKLIISFDGLPPAFEAFLIKNYQKTENYLINYYTINYAYSASVYYFNNNAKSKPSKYFFLGIAPEIFPYDPQKNLTKYNDRFEINENSLILKRKNADSANVMKTLKNYFPIIQIFTHASTKNGNLIYLYDKKVTSADSWGVKSQVIILTACQSARGLNYTGEGVMSFARNMRAEGVSSVVASLWEIPPQESADIAYIFRKEAFKKTPLNISLRKAKLEIMKKHPQPVDWAGIVLFGKDEPIL